MKKTIKDVDLKNKKVIMRVDFNVPLKNGKITDDTRIREAMPSIKYILEQSGASLILMSHLGRPDGQVKPEMSLKPAADRVSELLGKPVKMLGDCIGPDVEKACKELKAGEVIMLENLRFHPEEDTKDKEKRSEFAKKLAALADVYVNDAFGTAHREHASTATIARFMTVSVSGFLMEKEIKYFEKLLKDPDRPLVAILGGAKVSSKIGVITNLLKIANTIVIGGGMSYTFFKAMGKKIGNSLFAEEDLPIAENILKEAKAKNVELLLPVDNVITNQKVGDMFKDASLVDKAETKVVEGDIPDGWEGVDIGPKTIAKISDVLNKAKTVVWNGPMGVFEFDKFAAGTCEIAKKLADLNATTVIGGGDSVAAVNKFNLASKMSHVSTGGGASLEYLEGKVLPGVDLLNDK
jgi:3-phosphoglycerate kinase